MPVSTSIFLAVLLVYNLLFAIFVIFFEKRSPASTWAWLMVVALLPYVGSFIYLIIGFEARKHKTFANKAKEDKRNIDGIMTLDINGLRHFNEQGVIMNRASILSKESYEDLNDLVCLNFSSGTGALTFDNETELFFEGSEKFERLFEDIRGAKSFIHLEYYIFRNDKLGKRLLRELIEKARQGVEVCLHIDGMGSARVPKFIFREFKEAGGRLAVFIPPRFIRLNYRNHRKIAVIDGKLGYIGGLNIGDEYLGEKKRYGHWRDAHMRICGQAVKELELRFCLDWNHTSKYKIVPGDKYYPDVRFEGNVPIQIVSSGPDTKWPSVYQSYLKMISEAEHSIYIQTPYFIPDDAMLELLKIAALGGIDVRIMIPKNPDHPFVYWANTSYLSELVPAGVRCYEYKDGFVHSKLVMIDNKFMSVGTANMDVRSFKLNFEINAFVYDEKTTRVAVNRFLDDIKQCELFDQASIAGRRWYEKVKEAFSRLISPLL